MPRLLISAAEASGDLLGAELLTALRASGDWDVRGVAGPRLRAAGARALVLQESLAVMGLAELPRRLGAVRAARDALQAAVDSGDFDAIITIDAPDLHLPIARRARARGRLAIGYASPQVWAWRPGRVRSIARSLDALLCLFSFEPELYPPGFDARFVGHPVRDRVPHRGTPDPGLIALFPGSREQELRLLLPEFLEAARLLRVRGAFERCVLVVPEALRPLLPTLPPEVALGRGLEDVASARAALTKSGTITLELACMGVPQVVAHRVHPVTYTVGRALVRGVAHIALPNVLAGRQVVPEFVQHFGPEDLARAVMALPEVQAVDLAPIGPGGASARAALAVTELLARRSQPLIESAPR